MRKIFSTIMLVAAAAMTFASCQGEEMNAPKETFSTTLTLNTEVESTKTYLGADNTVLWGGNEQVTLFVQDNSEEPSTKFFPSDKTSAYDGQASANFTFSITDVPEAEQYTLGGIYPASASDGMSNSDATAYKVALPATQNASVDNYDPSAFIMVLKPEAVQTIPESYTASFRRSVALNKITLTGVKEDISSVEITVPEGKYLAGRRKFNLTTGASGEIYYAQTNTVTVNASYTGNEIDVWFTSWGVELAEGEELTIKMTSASKTYVRTIAARTEGIKFVEGDLNTLTVNMSSAEEETMANYSGQYLVAAKKGDNWALMAPTATDNYINAFTTNVAYTNKGCASFYEVAGIDNYVWTVTATDGGYSVCSYDGKYVAFPTDGGNSAELASESAALSLEIDDAQTATVTEIGSGRILSYNATSPRFAFYTGVQTAIYFIPWVADETPRIFVDATEYTVEAAAGTVELTYSTNSVVEGSISAAVKDGATMTVESATVSAGKVTVKYAENTDVEGKRATIVLSYNGAVSKEIVINQTAAGQTEHYYVKVTSAPTDWSGTYLIVAGTSVANGTITSSWLKTATVAVAEDKIEANATTNAYAVTIAKVTGQSYYSIKLPNGNYLGTPNSNSIKSANSLGDEFYWKFSVDNNLVKIESNAYSGRYLRLNGTSGFRAYTSTTGTQATLYRLETGSDNGGDTTDPDEGGGETPEQPSTGSTVDFTFSSNSAVTKDGVTVTFAKGDGSNAPAYYDTGLRLYAKNTIVVSSTTKTITKIEYVFTRQGTKGYASATGDATYTSGGDSTSSTDAKTDIWTGSSNSVTVTLGTSGQRVIKSIKVYTN